MIAISHLGFIVAAYAAAGLTIGAMIAWVVLDGRRLNAEFARATQALDGARRSAKGARP